eukprot:s2584_g8.t1
MEEERSEQCDLEDFLQRAALPLLFYAKKAKNEIKADRADKAQGEQAEEKSEQGARQSLLCIRLVAQQLQSLAVERMAPETEELALALAHWVSTEWCSPRIEVVDYLPCCRDEKSNFLLSKNCDHLKMKAVLDIVLFAPMPDGQEIGRQRLLHHGPWHTFSPVPGGWHTSYPAGAALHRWEEVTAAGLLLLAAAKTFKQQRKQRSAETEETQELCRRTQETHPAQRPAVLVYGACDGLLASFLAQHAPEVQVDLLDGELSGLDLLQKHFNLRLGGPGLLKGSCRVLGKPQTEREGNPEDSADVDSPDVEVAADACETNESETGERMAPRELYDGIVVMKPFGQSFTHNPSISSILSISQEGPGQHQEHQVKSPLPLRNGGLLLVEATPEDRDQLEKLGEVLELNDLLQGDDDLDADDATDSTVLCIVTPRSARTLDGLQTPQMDSFEELICPESWFELLLERGGVVGGAPDVLNAQKTRVVPAGKICPEDLAILKRLAGRATGCGREIRSPQSDSWQVLFLQTNRFFEEEAPDLLKRLADIARSVALGEKWVTMEQADRLQARVVEWHEQARQCTELADMRALLPAVRHSGLSGPQVPLRGSSGTGTSTCTGVGDACLQSSDRFELQTAFRFFRARMRCQNGDSRDHPVLFQDSGMDLPDIVLTGARASSASAHRSTGWSLAGTGSKFQQGRLLEGCCHFALQQSAAKPGRGPEADPSASFGNLKQSYRIAGRMPVEAVNAARRVRGIGLDGSVLEMPLLSLENITLSSARHVTISPHEPGEGANPMEGRRSWRFRARIEGPIASFPAAVDVGVGDIGLFQALLSQPQETIGDFDGPVALLGQDIMTQLPLRYSAARGTLWFRH